MPTATSTTSSSTPPATAASTRFAICSSARPTSPAVGRFKVFMIDEAHQLTKESFNALLKTLEEPPEYLKFVLATTDPEKMLPTVLSRCLQFNLRPMAPEVVHEHLVRVLRAEGVAHDELSLRLLSRAARGSMRDGLSLADQAIAYGGGSLTGDGVRAMLGSVERGHASRFVRALAARDGRAVLAGVDALREHGLSAAGALEEMTALAAADGDRTGRTRRAGRHRPRGERDTAPWPRCWRPTRPSCCTAWCCRVARSSTSLPDAYAGLTMVLLRLLAFTPEGSPPARPVGPAQDARGTVPDMPRRRGARPAARSAPRPSHRPGSTRCRTSSRSRRRASRAATGAGARRCRRAGAAAGHRTR